MVQVKKIDVEQERFDIRMMQQALLQAKKAALQGEVPVGAVVVAENQCILAEAGNCCIGLSDPAGHAEMRAVRLAGQRLGNYRLPGTTVYVTLEPCPMCAALLVHARVARLVFGAADPKGGAVISKYQIGSDGLLNHSFAVRSGVCAEECGQILQDFFRKRR